MDDRSKIMKMTYKAQQKKPHLLTANEAAALFAHLDICLQDVGCNHTHRFTLEWLDQHVNFMQHEAVLAEIEDMGGYCDCEVLANCYEDYEL